MEKTFSHEDQVRIKALLGRTFKGTVVSDPVIYPYIIVRYEDGGLTVFRVRGEGTEIKLSTIGYPSTFGGCLHRITREKLHEEEGKWYEALDDYVAAWEKINKRVMDTLGNIKI